MKIPKGVTPVTEDEKKSIAAEITASTQDTVDQRPETDFHFFSDTEVTKYVICERCSASCA